MKVVAKLESNGETVYEKPCSGDDEVGTAVCEAMNEAVATAHECDEPVLVEATWEDGSTALWRITVKAL